MGLTDCFGGGAAQNDEFAPQAAEQGLTVKTASVDVRLAFLRKVYSLLTINFCITIAVSCAFSFIRPVRDYIVERPWTLLVGFAIAMVTMIFIVCFRPRFPWDFIGMYVFVLAMSVFVGVVVARYYDGGYGIVVLKAFITTAAIFLSITAYVTVTKADFSFLYGFLTAAFIAFAVIALLTFVFSWVGRVSRLWSFVLSVVGALLMVGYLLYDTSLIVNKLGPDDWMQAVVSLYMDVTNLFLFLLNIFSFMSD